MNQRLKRLEELAPDSPVLSESGNPTFGEKFEHVEMMPSLAKCHTLEEIQDKFSGAEVIVMPKVDGLSTALHYTTQRNAVNQQPYRSIL